MLNKILRRSFALLLALTLTACTSSGKKEEAARVEDRSISAGPGDSGDGAMDDAGGAATAYGAGADSGSPLSLLDDPDSALSVRIIYFAYDSSTIQPQFNDAIAAHATFLAQHPEHSLTLEGHADERGSREYNLALGERRAEAVKQQMVLLGAAASQIRTSSYGEERPITTGHNEQSWAQNRRVEIVYNQAL